MSSLAVQDQATDTMCPVCCISIHDEKPVGITVGCGHIYHQDCYRAWQGKGSVLHESTWQPFDAPSKNCLICQQPTQSFVDLFIRLPDANSVCRCKDLVTKLEHEFNTVSRCTQLSLEKEIARREFEQTRLQEERQLSLAAKHRVEARHAKAIRAIDDGLKHITLSYQRKLQIGSRRDHHQRRNSEDFSMRYLGNDDDSPLGRSLASLRVAELTSVSSNSVASSHSERTDQHLATEAYSSFLYRFDMDSSFDFNSPVTSIGMPSLESAGNTNIDTEEFRAMGSGLTIPWYTSPVIDSPFIQELVSSIYANAQQPLATFNSHPASAATANNDNILPAIHAQPTRKCNASSDQELSAPTIDIVAAITSSPSDEEKKLPAQDRKSPPASSNETSDSNTNSSLESLTGSRKRKGGDYCKNTASFEDKDAVTAARSVVEYERQRLQAETAYFQHQAELVEWERHQAEIELEQDDLALQQRVQRIRLERSRLEASFTSIQRRVKESKQETKDRQKITAMEEKFAMYQVARIKEEERFQNELEHLKQDDILIFERESCEQKRQENEKVRLRKELNRLVNVMHSLEHAKEQVKLAEEQSSSSQTQEACVVCFEPLVNEESELGIAVPCGHAFHSNCFACWENSKRRRSTSVPCPLCNVGTNLCVTIRLNRRESSPPLYGAATSSSSLARHFQKEEVRCHRRRITGT